MEVHIFVSNFFKEGFRSVFSLCNIQIKKYDDKKTCKRKYFKWYNTKSMTYGSCNKKLWLMCHEFMGKDTEFMANETWIYGKWYWIYAKCVEKIMANVSSASEHLPNYKL